MIKEKLFEPVPMLFGGGDIIYAKNGAKLESVEISDTENVIPEGALHARRNDLSEEIDVTAHGIPIVTTTTDEIETFSELKESGPVVQHAEIETGEIIFNIELTQFLEEKRKEYHESEDPEILLEVGKRLTKEILTNTLDNSGDFKKIKNESNV